MHRSTPFFVPPVILAGNTAKKPVAIFFDTIS